MTTDTFARLRDHLKALRQQYGSLDAFCPSCLWTGGRGWDEPPRDATCLLCGRGTTDTSNRQEVRHD
jgi:hypothetical protein